MKVVHPFTVVVTTLLVTFIMAQDNFHGQHKQIEVTTTKALNITADGIHSRLQDDIRSDAELMLFKSRHIKCPQKKNCNKKGGKCQRKGTCEGKAVNGCKKKRCSCCLPEPTSYQCDKLNGFCVKTGNYCNGIIEILHNSYDDQCCCCIPLPPAPTTTPATTTTTTTPIATTIENWHPAILDGSPGATTEWDTVSFAAGQAFIDNPRFGWCSKKGLPASIWKQFYQPIEVLKLTYQARQDEPNFNWHAPIKIDVFGSNNEDCTRQDEWVILATDNSGNVMTKDDTKIINIPTNKARSYTCYGIRVNAATAGNFACISHIKFYIATTTTTTTIAPTTDIICPDKFVPIMKCCYYFSIDDGLKKKNWTEARKACQGMGHNIDLAEVGTIDECNDVKLMEVVASKGGENWFGATDAASEGNWVWQRTGQHASLSMNMWFTSEPDGDGDCLNAWVGSFGNNNRAYFWGRNCAGQWYYVCQQF